MAARPRRESLPEEEGLGQGPREVEELHRVDGGEGAARRGEPARQLDGRGEGRREEDEGAEAQGGGPILAPALQPSPGFQGSYPVSERLPPASRPRQRAASRAGGG